MSSLLENGLLDEGLLDDTAKYLPFLYEIRRRIFLTVGLFKVATIVGFIFYEKIIRFVLKLFDLKGINVVFTSPFQFINLAIQSSLAIGLVAILPFVIYQIISFLRPALSPKEFRAICFMIPTTIILFLIGFTYGIVMMRYAVTLFYQKSVELNIGNILDVTSFISQIFLTAILLGVAFEFPLLITGLIRSGAMKLKTFTGKRVIIYVGCLIFATLLPPTDLVSLVLLTLPLLVLFEATILFNKTFKRKL